MRCLICGKTYFIKRTIKTLFTTKRSDRCLSCMKKYQINLTYQVIPKERGSFYIFCLFDEVPSFDLIAFNSEIAYIIKQLLNLKKRKDPLIWVDRLNSEILFSLDNLDDDIYILTNHIYL
ncbi:MAG: hypothetical protein WC939_00810 [Acholeplasmataceae bacterium]